MRHSDIKLTMNVYTDPALLDVRGALDALPGLPLGPTREAGQATGTAGDFRHGVCSLAPTLAPTPDNSVQTPSAAGNPAGGDLPNPVAASGSAVKGKGRLSSADNRPSCRGDRRQTFPNESGGQQLLWLALSQTVEFAADSFFGLSSA